MIWKIIIILWMVISIISAFLIASPAEGFPGQTSRILFFHVPQAWIATLCFLLSMIASCQYLAKRRIRSDDLAFVSAELGFLFCILATLTGMVFAKATWGSFWNWDPRETSIVFLLMIYGAYFALRSAVLDMDKKRTFAAAYSILAFLAVPFLVFIIPRITVSLHPENTMNPANPGMDLRTLIIFLSSLAAYTAVWAWLIRLRLQLLNLMRKIESRIQYQWE